MKINGCLSVCLTSPLNQEKYGRRMAEGKGGKSNLIEVSLHTFLPTYMKQNTTLIITNNYSKSFEKWIKRCKWACQWTLNKLK